MVLKFFFDFFQELVEQIAQKEIQFEQTMAEIKMIDENNE